MEQSQTVCLVGVNSHKTNFPHKVELIAEIAQLPEKACFAIILAKKGGENWLNLLTSLRARKRYRYSPVFYLGEITDAEKELFDGPADEKLTEQANKIHQRLAMVSENNIHSDHDETIVLSYLFSRVDSRLRGYVRYQTTHIYYYPLLAVLLTDQADFDGWRFLQDLVMRDLLVQGNLLDEIQTCPVCDSGLLNFKNSCPSCHSINFKPQKFVHCYSCGKIGPIPEFLRQERLVCSRCNVKLSQLGIDYEKPMEDKLCNDCGHYFAEPEINLVCLVCQRTWASEELTTRRLYDYILTARAEYIIKGTEKCIYRNFNNFFRAIDYVSFMAIITWQAKLAQRYSALYFCVLNLQILNENQLIKEEHLIKSEKMMGEFFANLRQIFRESDLSSRIDGTMLFFLPMVDEDGCLMLVERIKQFVPQSVSNDHCLNVGLSYITSTEIINCELAGELMVSELHTRMMQSNLLLIERQ